MKREKLNTNVLPETKAGLEIIAKREKQTDHGIPSKGRAIDWLVNYYKHTRMTGASESGEAVRKPVPFN